jgi:acetyl-CoA synthetase
LQTEHRGEVLVKAAKLIDYTSYQDAQRQFSSKRLWDLFDGTREQINAAHECVDRHVGRGRTAINIVRAEGGYDSITFEKLSELSARFANYLVGQGVKAGDRVAVMLDPTLAFYVGLFGTMKCGAIAVPLFTAFGPDGLRLRLSDCAPKILLTNAEKAKTAEGIPDLSVVIADDCFYKKLEAYSASFKAETTAEQDAVFQYTSGTTRELPEAVRHSHRSIVTLMVSALYGIGLRPGDTYFCPSSPAWGHGMWHGTLAPLALGITTGAYSGKFSAVRLCEALQDLQITNMSAAATHYRLIKNSGRAEQYKYRLNKLSYTGEPIDSETLAYAEKLFGVPICSMYGTTEIGVILVNYPGAEDFPVKPGSLGKAVPGMRVDVQDASGAPCAAGVVGELKVWRRNEWYPTKDLGQRDGDGYFYHCGRADDVIISAGWTISAVEVEGAVLQHPDVREVAVVGAPDKDRGLVVKAYVIAERKGDETFTQEIQNLVRTRLAQHEYPRLIEYVLELPKTPAGKINRRALRERARQ